jgi:heme/copper-type cytochrome/quinol oxidase subunit 1
MSLDRYLTLRYPLKYGRNKRRSLMAYKIVTIWLISFAICLPLFVLGLVDSSNVYDEQTRACFPAHRTFKIYGSFVAFLIPLIIMVVTYALTMTALQQAHITKKERNKRRERMRAVMNIAAIAIRWKRAVSTVEIPDENKPTIVPEQETQSIEEKLPKKNHERKRASSLLTNAQPKNPIFTSIQRLNQSSNTLSPLNWRKHKEKSLEPLREKSSKNEKNNIRNSLTKSIYSLPLF